MYFFNQSYPTQKHPPLGKNTPLVSQHLETRGGVFAVSQKKRIFRAAGANFCTIERRRRSENAQNYTFPRRRREISQSLTSEMHYSVLADHHPVRTSIISRTGRVVCAETTLLSGDTENVSCAKEIQQI